MQRLEPQYVLGIDISNHQGSVDMSQWRASGIEFVYAKASEGTGYVDPFFAGNAKQANSLGIPVGAYHFACPSLNTAVSEADFFIKRLRAVQTTLDPCLDLEDPNYKGTAGALIEWVREFVGRVKEQTGRQVILYTGKWYAERFQGFQGELSDLPLWYSWYNDPQTSTPPDFGGWTRYVIWQYTDSGNIAGVNGPVDLNYAVSLEAIGHTGE